MYSMQSRVFILLALLVSASSHADIYAFVDASGVTHFSNVPDDERYEVILEAGNYDVAPPLHPALLKLSVHYDAMIREAATGADVDPELLRAVIVVESGFDTNAVSRAGAQGLMQLMPATARTYGVTNVFDPRENVEAGARYLRDLIDRYDDDYELVLAAYNAGETAVAKYGGRIPPYPETRNYIPKVLGVYNRLLQMTDAG
jgi:soluble lytic murein transglycosylase-like protein